MPPKQKLIVRSVGGSASRAVHHWYWFGKVVQMVSVCFLIPTSCGTHAARPISQNSVHGICFSLFSTQTAQARIEQCTIDDDGDGAFPCFSSSLCNTIETAWSHINNNHKKPNETFIQTNERPTNKSKQAMNFFGRSDGNICPELDLKPEKASNEIAIFGKLNDSFLVDYLN